MIRADADLAVVVVPREKYRCARKVVGHLERIETPDFRLVWVDEARTPRRLRRWIEQRAAQPGFFDVHLPQPAGANACRMAGLEAARTPFVLFLDNDAFPARHALAAMVECMDETGASFVAPVYLESDATVHNAGGTTRLEEGPDGHRLVEHHLVGARADAQREQLVRSRTGILELHAVLVRVASLRAAGGLDADLQAAMDCADASLRLQHLDGGGWLEPRAEVTYDDARPALTDLPLYLSRWSRSTVEGDIARFVEIWGLDATDPHLDVHRAFFRARRVRVVRGLVAGGRHVLGPRTRARLGRAFDTLLDRVLRRRADRSWPAREGMRPPSV